MTDTPKLLEPYLNKITHGDCIDVLRALPDNSIDLIACDPPYFLIDKSGKGFMNKEWDSISSLWKYAWKSKEFVRFAVSVLQQLKIELDSGEENTVHPNVNTKQEEIKELAPLAIKHSQRSRKAKKDFAPVLALTRQEVLDLLKELCGRNISKNLFPTGEKKDVRYVIPALLHKGETTNTVAENALKKRIKQICEANKIHLTLTDVQKIKEAIGETDGKISGDKYTSETTGPVNCAEIDAERKLYNAITLNHIDKAELTKNLTLSLCAIYATRLQKKIHHYLLDNFMVLVWRECLRVLKPGAFAFVMCIPRQDCQSRMIVNLEEAGFNVAFTSMYHAFAQGFPKAMNIGKAVDKKRQDDIRPVCRWLRNKIENSDKSICQIADHFGFNRRMVEHWVARDTDSQPSLPTWKQWIELKKLFLFNDEMDSEVKRLNDRKGQVGDVWKNAEVIGKLAGDDAGGFGDLRMTGDNDIKRLSEKAQSLCGSYAGFQPKPAVELILVAMKPLSEKSYVDQAMKDGKGVTWLDDGRIPYKDDKDIEGATPFAPDKINKSIWESGKKRGDALPNTQGRFPANLLVSDDVLNDGRMTEAKAGLRKNKCGMGIHDSKKGTFGKGDVIAPYDDSGSFSRYFSLDAWFDKAFKQLPESVRKTFPFLVVPKAASGEKNEGLDDYNEQTVSDGRNKSIDNPFQRGETPRRNIHPTSKPLQLMMYLITIGSRPGDIVLDPFVGSGTTALAAKTLGRNFIATEINKEYAEIARARLAAMRQESLF